MPSTDIAQSNSRFARLRTKFSSKVATAVVTSGAVLGSANALALTTEANTLITTAYAAAEGSVELVVAGMLGIALILCGFYVVYNILKK